MSNQKQFVELRSQYCAQALTSLVSESGREGLMIRNRGHGTGPHSTNNYTSLQLSQGRGKLSFNAELKKNIAARKRAARTLGLDKQSNLAGPVASKKPSHKPQSKQAGLHGQVKTRRGMIPIEIPVTTFRDREYERVKAEVAASRARFYGGSPAALPQLSLALHPNQGRCQHGARLTKHCILCER